MKKSVKPCQSWIVVNGNDLQCQWQEGHFGCHSSWNEDCIKIKWEVKEEERKK